MSDATELNGRDTDPDVLTTLIVNTLKEIKGELVNIRDRLDKIDEHQQSVDDQMRCMVTDFRTIHALQKGTMTRLHDLEKHWVDEPLETEKASAELQVVEPSPFPMAAKKRKT